MRFKHLSGKHDQSTHGIRGDRVPFTSSQRISVGDEYVYVSKNGTEKRGQIVEDRGNGVFYVSFYGKTGNLTKPTVVSPPKAENGRQFLIKKDGGEGDVSPKKADKPSTRQEAVDVTKKPISDYRAISSQAKDIKIGEYLESRGDFETNSREAESLKREYDDWANGLTKDEFDAINTYTGAGYLDTNRNIRNGIVGRDVELLDSALSKGSLTEDTQLFRHVPLDTPAARKAFASLKTGQVFSDPAYMSTSSHTDSYKVFEKGSGGASIRIRAPKGSKGGFLYGQRRRGKNMTRFPSEMEFLLPRGSNFYINEVVRLPSGEYHIDMTLLPEA